MRLAHRHSVLGATVALVIAAGFATAAQANTTLPGLNGKIAFTSQRDFPFVPAGDPLRGGTLECEFGALCSNEIYSMNPDGSSPTRLTNNILNDDEAAWLPADGSKIAFEEADSSDQGTNIWSMNGDGGSPVQLTNDTNYNSHATYSPDGTHIAFASTADAGGGGAAATRLGSINNESIWIMPAGGGTPTPLLPASQLGSPDGVTEDLYPSWSPDGTQIAFTRVTFSNIEGLSADRLPLIATVDERTYIAPASGTGPATPVETNYTNPDCTEFVLPFPLNPQTITKALQPRLPTGGTCTGDAKPAWSPDGSKLAVWRFTSTGLGIPSPSRRAIVPDTSDGGDVIVIPLANPAAEVNLSDVSEPNCTSSGSPACSTDKDPTWSPDGMKIAFDSNRTSDGTESSDCPDGSDPPTGNCDYEIWAMNADGSGLQQLTNNAYDDTDPDWQRIPPPPPPVPPVTPPVTPAAVPPKVGVAGVRRACVSKSFHVRFHITTTASSVKSVVVKLDGRRIKTTSKASFTLSINSKKLKAGRHRLTITATDSHGKVTTTHKTFSVCRAAKPRKRTAPRFTG